MTDRDIYLFGSKLATAKVATTLPGVKSTSCRTKNNNSNSLSTTIKLLMTETTQKYNKSTKIMQQKNRNNTKKQ